jgi:hypothetical protein
MKKTSLLYFTAFCAILTITCSCSSDRLKTVKTESNIIVSQIDTKDSIATSKKHDFELADALVYDLLDNGADTVLLYKRTCINCCDFFNVFWTKNGKQFLHKFYFDFDDQLDHSMKIELTSTAIFSTLKSVYSTLKMSSIKDNVSKNKDGTSTTVMSSHYCYSLINIYTQNDSIISNRMKDTDFSRSSGIKDDNGTQLVNENYKVNIHSNWNILLTEIEMEIADMSETSTQENKILRVATK